MFCVAVAIGDSHGLPRHGYRAARVPNPEAGLSSGIVGMSNHLIARPGKIGPTAALRKSFDCLSALRNRHAPRRRLKLQGRSPGTRHPCQGLSSAIPVGCRLHRWRGMKSAEKAWINAYTSTDQPGFRSSTEECIYHEPIQGMTPHLFLSSKTIKYFSVFR